MPSMFVTPAVFQLEMYSLMLARPLKRPLMSVMPATSKLSMGPNLLSVAIGSESHATSAALSSALVVKMCVARRRPLVVGTGMLAARSDERGKSCAV
eukprot:scaffold79336_cov57-Phaeocystis_antarctica.AAC.4